MTLDRVATPLPPALPAASLSAARRSRDLEAVSAGPPLDVLVIGGGVTGVGIALDAATRGMTVALVERGDLAQGTSRQSSKLVHGGLRYLAHGDVALAYESARERRLLMTRTAPHLVRALPVLTPIRHGDRRAGTATVGAALWAGDVLARATWTSRDAVPAPRRVRAVEAVRMAPALSARGLRGGLVHWEGQLEDDARLVVALARTAAAHGARVLTYCRAESASGDGAVVRDLVGGTAVEVRARHVVNATGVWAQSLDPEVRLRPSKGAHLVVRSASLGHPAAALALPVPGERARFALVLPQQEGLTYVGLTDEPHLGPVPDEAEVTSDEQSFLLAVLGDALDCPLTSAEVVGSFAGFRPLLDSPNASARTADLSRRHAIHRHADGLVTITGGKLTTYRRMAQDVVDLLTDVPCRTGWLPLVGAGTITRHEASPLPTRLVRRFGTEASAVAALIRSEPTLGEPVARGLPVLGAEVAWAVRHEGALTLDDVLHRRTRLGLVPADTDRAHETVEAIVQGCLADAGGT